MKLILKIIFLFTLLSGVSHAQKATYLMTDGTGRDLGHMTFTYNPQGYVATAGGQHAELLVSPQNYGGWAAYVTVGKLQMFISIDTPTWWHNRVGHWRTAQVSTSFGDKGVYKTYYAGLTPLGRNYKEEFWLNGRLFNKSQTVIDHNDHVVWATVTDAEGTLRIDRIK